MSACTPGGVVEDCVPPAGFLEPVAPVVAPAGLFIEGDFFEPGCFACFEPFAPVGFVVPGCWAMVRFAIGCYCVANADVASVLAEGPTGAPNSRK